ncbi:MULTISPECIES: ABC transporter permease [Protofrankia]|uniref:ABC-type transporter, integral membrane subunit n=1 Tax=Candidatus Protofrankia datiscae TaxID=2716812 RepID=F8AVC0_9ACTN|nr:MULTISPECIES: ABC transporter permease [Protofrankia]AEH08212.1 ABC-type transporter, integral membrane subunit [Candidatus Protofrankia datiscae]
MAIVENTRTEAGTRLSASAGSPVAASRRSWLPRAGRIAGGISRRVVGILILLAAWETLPRLGVVDRVFLPPFSEVADEWVVLLRGGDLWEHTSASLTRAASGFAIAIAIALPLGLLIGWFRLAAQFLNPVLEVFRNTAPLALLPVFVLIFGLGETSKIAIIVYACVWPVLLNTISGVQGVDPLLVKSARSMGLPSVRLFQKVILPAAVPTIFTGVRLAGAYAILILVAAELVGAQAGLGYLINYAQSNFAIPEMYAGIITVSVVGLIINQGLLALERRFTRWRITSNS